MTDFKAMEQLNSKGSISEEDMSTLLQRSRSSGKFRFCGVFLLNKFWIFGFFFFRYSPATVLTLLQEVANFPGAKIDWHGLVKKTSTGISNAREYQMLWRHLAYRNTLLDRLEDVAEPLVSSNAFKFLESALIFVCFIHVWAPCEETLARGKFEMRQMMHYTISTLSRLYEPLMWAS